MVKLSSDLASGYSVTIGTINTTEARPKNGFNGGIGFIYTRGIIAQINTAGEISIRNIGSSSIPKDSEIYLSFFYPINM